MPSTTSPAVAYSIACVGIAIFCAMDAMMKGLGLAMGAYNALFWRMATGLVLAAAAFAASSPRWPTPALLRLHVGRGVIVTGMGFLWFYGITLVPLAEAVAISFIAPLIALFLAALFLGERVGPRAIAATLLGLAGVGVILAAKFGGDQASRTLIGVGAIVSSAVLYAVNLVLQRHQAQKAPPQEIAFFQSLTVTICLAFFAPFFLIWPEAGQWPLIGSAALFGFTSLLLLSWAYARAEAQILVTTEYSGFLWLSLLGWLFFDEVLTLSTIAGAALIVAGSLIAARTPAPVREPMEAAL